MHAPTATTTNEQVNNGPQLLLQMQQGRRRAKQGPPLPQPIPGENITLNYFKKCKEDTFPSHQTVGYSHLFTKEFLSVADFVT
jgi:hypothetical protein